MTDEKCLIIQNIAYDLMEEKKYHSALDVLFLILKEFPQKENETLYEDQLLFNYLGFSFMEIGDLENAEKSFQISLKTEEFIGDVYVYLTRINMFLRPVSLFGGRDYKKALVYIRQAFSYLGSYKNTNISKFSAYDENKVLGIYFETLYLGFQAKELKDIDVEIMSLLRDMMLLNFNEFNIFEHMGYFLRYGFGENDLSEEVRKIDLDSIDPKVYNELLHKIIDITYYEEEIKFYYNFSEIKGNIFEELKPNFVTIKERLDFLEKTEEVSYKYRLVSKYKVKKSIEFYKEKCPFSKSIYYIATFHTENQELIYKTVHFYKLAKIIKHFFKYNEVYKIDKWMTLKDENLRKMELLTPIFNEVVSKIEKIKYNKIILNNEVCDIYVSKVGGVPYMPIGVEYPLSRIDNNPLALLAQINFKEMPILEGFPTEGILQFFIPYSDYLHGMDFDNPTKQDNFRIIFHGKVDDSIEQQNIPKPILESDEEILLPFEHTKEYKIKFIQNEDLNYSSEQFCFLFKEICKVRFDVEINEIEEFQNLFDVYIDEVLSIGADGHKIGGTPLFIQYDPREQNEDIVSHKDILLFQLDSDFGENNENEIDICWGDMGCANFFISHKDLLNKKFDNVLYDWSCT